MAMPSNNTGFVVGTLFGRYPDKIGMLASPDGWREPRLGYTYALDNGCFKKWDSVGFFNMLQKATKFHEPLWVCVPDAVADAETTLRRWHKYAKIVEYFGFKLAFVAQDGMLPSDVPTYPHVECVFIGGSTEWKLNSAHLFKGVANKLHIGRVNTIKRVKWAKGIKADSFDGTGWTRGRDRQEDLIYCFERGLL